MLILRIEYRYLSIIAGHVGALYVYTCILISNEIGNFF